MQTPLRQATLRLTTRVSLAIAFAFLAMGCFDTLRGQSLTVNPSTLVFTANQGSNPNPADQTITTGGSGTFIVSFAPTGSWLSATVPINGIPSTGGTAGDNVVVQVSSVSPTNLAVGSYNGTVTLTPSTGTAVVINVTLTVSGGGTTTSTLSASPSQLSFAYQLTKAGPTAETTQITSSGISLPISFSTNAAPTSNCPAGWFQASLSQNTTPATLTVSITTTGLAPGSCTGNVTITSNTAANGTTTTLVGVTLFVASGPVLNISVPTGLQSVTLQQGTKPVQFSLGLTSSDSSNQLSFNLTASSSNNWLAITPSSGMTPASITVQITPGTNLSPGNYTGSITVNSPGILNNSLTIPISLTITSQSALTVSPAGTLNFTELQGGSLPASQVVTLTGGPQLMSQYTTSVIQGTGGAWLQITPTNGSITPGPQTSSTSITLSVTAAGGALAQGTYSAQAAISFLNNTIPQIIIPVSLTVQPPASAIVATPSAVSFSYQAGSANPPAAQSISISNPASGSLAYTIGSVSDSWISVTPTSGTTPGTISVSVSPQNLQPGSYNGSFVLSAPSVGSTTVTVALFISASVTPQPYIISNAASGLGGALAPGEIITIKGTGLGPGTPVSFSVSTLTTANLAGTEVMFDQNPGTLLYVSSTQINVIVPYEVANRASTNVVVTYQGVASAGFAQPVAAAALGLFTDNATGSGQAAVLNQNYSYNTVAAPAPEGSYIAVYATGGGQTTPASIDGEVSPTTSLLPLNYAQYVTATIGGKNAPVVFSGAAPGYVTGVVQFNIQVPTGVSGSALPLIISIGGPAGVVSQSTATVAVQ